MILTPRNSAPEATQQLLAQGCPSILAPLLAARGVMQYADLKPSLAQLLPPDGLKNAQRVATLLADAIEHNESICVVADYDCDGATACAVAVLGLGMLGATQVDFLVPNRFKTGYGLTPEVVEQVAVHPRLKGKNATHTQSLPDWIVTVDNGIASVQGIALANSLGIRTLVTDHHLAGDVLPDAAAILNPNQPECGFASKSIAGVGVMFYALLLARAELRKRGAFTLSTQPKLDSLLDLVAIGTVADVVKLDANNRALVGAGLERIRKSAMNGTLRPGVAALFTVAGRDPRTASTADIGFTLGPRINAAGRLDDMSLGIACLMSNDPAQAQRLASQLQAMNQARRELEGDMQTEAVDQAEAAFAASAQQSVASGLVLYDPSWHQGVVGLVASRIKDRYWRPTLAFAPANDVGQLLRGSGRSIAGFHIRDALDIVSKRHPSLIQTFGGHAMAAGLSIAAIDFPAFKAAFEAVCRELLGAQTPQRVLLTDVAPRTTEMTADNIALLESQVWGQGFEAPLFESNAVVLEQRLLKDAHLKFKIDIHGKAMDAIWFGHTEALPTRIKLAYRLSINEFRGERTVQAIVEHAEAA